MSASVFAELASLCSSVSDTERVRLVLEREKLSPVAVLTVLQQAVAADHAVLVEVVLRITGATCDVNAPVLKDGKTLLHLAAAKRNLTIVRLLVEAGAKLSAADKKGVRVGDTVAWTEVIYPAVACPLQNAVFKLEQRNERLEDDTRALHDAAGKTVYAADMLELENENALEELAAAVRYKQSLLNQIEVAQQSLDETNASIVAHGPRSQAVADEIERVRASTATMVAQVEATCSDTARLRKESERLRRRHAEQLAQLAVVGKQCAVKCEAVATVDRFSGDAAVQQRFLRALVAMCQRVEAARRLAMGGVQSRVLDTLARHGDRAEVARDGARVVLQLMETAQRHPQDMMLITYLKPWPVEVLFASLETALARQTTVEGTALVLGTLVDLLEQLPRVHEQTDRSGKELQEMTRDTARRLLQTASAFPPPETLRVALHKLAT